MTERERRTADDLALSALLDDALDGDEAERLRRRIAAEPSLARRLDELRAADGVVRGTYAAIVDEPLPKSVTDLLRATAEATPSPSRATQRFGWRPTLAAAGLALAAGFVLALLVLPRAHPVGPLGSLAEGGLLAAGSPLHEVLQTLPSDETRTLAAGWAATPRLTFLGADGDPCRRVDVSGAEGGMEALACRHDGAWKLELIGFTAPSTATPDGVYRPASGGAPSPVDRAIAEMIEGAPLGGEQERAWIDRDWQPPSP